MRSPENAETVIAEALVRADVSDIDALTEHLIAVRAKAQVAERDRDKAQAHRPICVELDRRISAAQPMVDSMRELSFLADGKFTAAVVRRRLARHALV